MRAFSRWRKAKLDDVVDLRLSSVDKKSKPREHGVRLCNYLDVYKNRFIRSDTDFMLATATEREIAKCTLLAGDVVITKDSEKYDDIGVPALIRENISNLVCGYHLAILRPIPEVINGTYLFYTLSSFDSAAQFHSLANGVTRFGLRKADILRVEVPLPPLPEQRAIADILGTLDDKIGLNQRIDKTLEEMAQALFKSWFIDFDPVRAKMEGRWRRPESLPGLPSELYDLFPDRLVDSQLGLIPEGWKATTLSNVVDHPRRNVWPNQLDPETPYLSLQHMPKKSIALTNWGTASRVGSIKFAFKRGEILFGKLRPYFHKVGVAPVDGVCSTDIVVLAPKGRVWFAFVLGHVSSTAFVDYANRSSTGTRMPRANWTDMGRYDLVLPSESVAKAFTAHVEPLVERIDVGIHESRKLAGIRDTLLPQLVGGKLPTDPKYVEHVKS